MNKGNNGPENKVMSRAQPRRDGGGRACGVDWGDREEGQSLFCGEAVSTGSSHLIAPISSEVDCQIQEPNRPHHGCRPPSSSRENPWNWRGTRAQQERDATVVARCEA